VLGTYEVQLQDQGSALKRFARWLFADSPNTPSPWRVIAWWELRRIPFNIIIGIYGVLCLIIFFFSILTSGHLQVGEDAVERWRSWQRPLNQFPLYAWMVGRSACAALEAKSLPTL
jgi:hypothetical protein